MSNKRGLIIISILVLSLFIYGCCPPAMFPQPPGCGVEDQKIVENKDLFSLNQPIYPESRSDFVFPPSCDMIPDKIAQSICQDYKKGAMIFWKEEACIALPFKSGQEVCEKEREVLKKMGDKNIPKLRKNNLLWWKTPYLNTYVYGDIRLRTEELQPTVSVWGQGDYQGWRGDEIQFTHATNTFKIVDHSFGVLRETDLNYMKHELIAEKGIVIKSPQDLELPEVKKINNDFEYLKQESKIYQALKDAEAKDIDGNSIISSKTFPNGKTIVAGVDMNPINPLFRKFLIDYFKNQVDANADGIMIDDISGSTPNKAFDDYNMKLFSVWLAKNDNQKTLADAGVSDLSSFDYRLYLKSKEYTAAQMEDLVGKKIGATDRWKSIPLMFLFRKFLIENYQAAFMDITTQVKTYAKEKGRADFVITSNAAQLTPASAFAMPYVDFFSFEHVSFKDENNPLATYTPIILITKLANAKEIPVTNQIVVTEWPIFTSLKEDFRYDLLRLGIMESYAAKSAQHYVRYSANDPRRESGDMQTVYSAMENRKDLQEVQKAYGFAKKYRDYLKDYTISNAKVAIVLDNNEIQREWKNYLTANHQYSVEDIGKIMFNSGIEYDIINWKQAATGNYKVIILPLLDEVSAEDLNLLKQAKQKGADIISTQTIPLNVNGLVDQQTTTLELSELVKTKVLNLILPAKMNKVIYKNDKGEYLVHLFNYDFNANGFNSQKNIGIDKTFFHGATKFYFASLEKPELIELDSNNPVISELKTYGMVVVKK